MSISRRRTVAVARKELTDLRRNGNIVYAMVILPVVFLVQPVVQLFTLSARAAPVLHRDHTLIYLLAVPALVPAALAAYTIVGERLQGTLEPLLTTPVTRRELVLGKAAAVVIPSVVIAYAVFALYVIVAEVFADPRVAAAQLRGSDVLAQIVFTPLLVVWSTWVGMSISARASDVRTAGQLAVLVSLPVVGVTSLIAFGIIPAETPVALAFGAALVILDRVGWRVAASLFDRERLITATR